VFATAVLVACLNKYPVEVKSTTNILGERKIWLSDIQKDFHASYIGFTDKINDTRWKTTKSMYMYYKAKALHTQFSN
jgi:hypothetical protein